MVLALSACLTVLTADLSSTWAATTLGDITFPDIPPRPLPLRSVSSEPGSLRYLWENAGVSFGAIAQPEDGIAVAKLEYRPTAPNGERLAVHLRTAQGTEATATARLYDWQLIPIANLVMDDANGLVTLFGKLEDDKKTKEARERGDLIVNLHPNLADTLLGLRLIQADMLMLFSNDPEKRDRIARAICFDLPKESGKYLLGEGEAVPDQAANQTNYMRLKQQVKKLEDQHGPYRSFLISDEFQTVSFSNKSGYLELTGYPRWWFWRLPSDNEATLSRLAKDLSEKAVAQLDEQLKRDIDGHFSGKYTPTNKRKRVSEIYERLWDQAVAPGPHTLPEFLNEWTAEVSKGMRDADGINPAVYRALVSTMRYRAFFRYVKNVSPETYATFVRSLPNQKTTKTLVTPTVIPLGDILRKAAGSLERSK